MDRRSACPAQLLSPRLRAASMAVFVGAVGVLVVLGFRYSGTSTPGRVDRYLDAIAHRTLDIPVWGFVDVYFQQLGDMWNATVLIVIVAVTAALIRGVPGAALAVLAPVLATAVTELLVAPMVGRRFGVDLSFPSGHVTTVASVAVALIVVLLGRGQLTALRVLSSLAALVVGAASTLAVVAERTHYTTDAVGGWCAAVATVLITSLVLDTMTIR